MWPIIYLTVPIFFPYFFYSTDKSDWSQTVFSPNNYGWYFSAVHFIAVGLVSAWIGKNRNWSNSFAVYSIVVLIFSLLAHVTLQLLGFEYFMETP